jgi:hypothetical protein
MQAKDDGASFVLMIGGWFPLEVALDALQRVILG